MNIEIKYHVFKVDKQILTCEVKAKDVDLKKYKLVFAEVIENKDRFIQPVLLFCKIAENSDVFDFKKWEDEVKRGDRRYWGSINKALDKVTGRKNICAVVGCKESSKRFTPEVQKQAHSIGLMAAGLGFTVLTGGLSGVMSMAAEGASSLQGETLGILPGTEKSDANSFVQQVLPSGIGIARNYSIALACDMMVALDGGRGTMEEMCFALDFEKPVFSWGSWNLDEAKPIQTEDQLFEHMIKIRQALVVEKMAGSSKTSN